MHSEFAASSRYEHHTGHVTVIGSGVHKGYAIDNGWALHLQPGEHHVEKEKGTNMNPRNFIWELRNDKRKPESWLEYCEPNGFGHWPLAPLSAPAAS